MSFFHAPIESRLLKKVKGLSLTFGTAPDFKPGFPRRRSPQGGEGDFTIPWPGRPQAATGRIGAMRPDAKPGRPPAAAGRIGAMRHR